MLRPITTLESATRHLGKLRKRRQHTNGQTELNPDSKYYRINYRRCRLHIRRSGTEGNDTEPDTSEQPVENSHGDPPDAQ